MLTNITRKVCDSFRSNIPVPGLNRLGTSCSGFTCYRKTRSKTDPVPWIFSGFRTTDRVFPLPFGQKSFTKMLAIHFCIFPTDSHDGVIPKVFRKLSILPTRRKPMPGAFNKLQIFIVGRFINIDVERFDSNGSFWRRIVKRIIAAHHKNTSPQGHLA